jgi:hypothetical protein
MKLKRFEEINEGSIRNKMLPKSESEILSARNKVLDDLLNKLSGAIEIIKYVSKDYQLDYNSEDYTGFLNMSIEDFDDDEEMGENLKNFVYLYKNGYKKFIDDLLDKVHLSVSGNISEDEVVIEDTLRNEK